ncbi:MAG: hypothetical protein HYZ14_05655 [Bacteroidetes bacterium]|nr:hypothetical protein [Bacteroidota bacterium]
MSDKILHISFVLFVSITLGGCATYYDKNRAAETALIDGNFDKAAESIRSNKFLLKERNALLFNLEMGKICHLKGEFEQSNLYFNEADRLMEEFQTLPQMALGITVNPSLQPYKAAYHEQIMIHYYKSLNYLQLGNMEDALVEVRRLDLKEKALEVSAKGKDKKYSQDAFGFMLMGMIYEADRDYNNAFIAYRNAKLAYESDQTGIYHNNQPDHLEQAILRNAKRSGIYYESDVEYLADYAPNGELILFCESGLSPVKAEQNYFFSLNQNADGFFFQSNTLVIPVDYDFSNNNPNFDPADLGTIRVAFPYYVSRDLLRQQPTVTINQQPVQLKMAQDISALAFQIEKDNFLTNMIRDLIRVTLKKISELAIAKQNDYAGYAMNIANMATEKADTRSWQSLPGQIQFARIPLEAGKNEITISTESGTQTLEVEGNGTIQFRNVCDY